MCILLAQTLPAQESPRTDSLTTLDSSLTELDLAFTPEESQALGLETTPLPLTDSALPVLEISVHGVDPHVIPFVKFLLPLHQRQNLSQSELDAVLSGFNERIAGRTDLFESCVAMAQPQKGGWRVLIEARSRAFGTYGGGNAYGYFGHNNRNRVGDQWGAWIGANRIGYHQDNAMSPGRYIGGMIRIESPMEASAPDHDLQHIRAAISFRQILSTTQAWDIEAGLWAVRDPDRRLDGRTPLSPYLKPAWESDQTWAKERIGIGGFSRLELTSGQNLSNERTFGALSLQTVLRTSAWHRLSLLATGDAESVVHRPAFHPALAGGFGVWHAQGSDPALAQAATASIVPHLSLWQQELWFTGLDAGIHGLLEAYATKGDTRHQGTVQGAGAHFAFRPPVGVEFLITSAWEGGRFLGVRLVTARDF